MEWFEDESFWRDFYPYMFDEARWAKARGQVESVLRLAGITSGARLGLNPGGVLVMDLHGTETIAMLKTPTVWKEDPQGKIVIMHAEPLDGWQRLRNSWVLLDEERTRRFEFALNLYSGAQLAKMLETAGFGDIKLFGSLDGTPYDATGRWPDIFEGCNFRETVSIANSLKRKALAARVGSFFDC